MAETRRIVVCSCEDTMTLDVGRIAQGCRGAEITTARHLCRTQLDLFRRLAQGSDLTVACVQEQPLFEEVAEDDALPARLSFANIRETAGWSRDGAAAAPKMAALLAAATEAAPPPAAVTLESAGVALVYASGPVGLEAARRLEDHLDITLLLLDAEGAVPPRQTRWPVRKGRITKVVGHLGRFEITVDAMAEPAASSRDAYVFGPGRNGAISRADLLIDLTGGPPLVTGPEFRDGYVRADPRNPLELERALAKAADLTGTFDKPRYVDFTADLCAHSRSRIVGCRRCLDLCPAGAIAPAGNHVAIDPAICGGCGQCAAACPTGAAAYALPPTDALLRKLRAMLRAYRDAGGRDAVLLVHDDDHGSALIDAAARFGDGLPAHVIPFAVNEVTQVGLEVVAAAFAYGAAGVQFLARARPRHDIAGLRQTIATSVALVSALGFGERAVGLVEADDPDLMLAALTLTPPGVSASRPSGFLPMGKKRDLQRLALRELHRAAPTPADVVALPTGAAFGRVVVKTEGCTLCLACVSACPTQALGDNRERPQLTFDESLCVQCGLCQATCPERVISLEPRLAFAAFEAGRAVLKEEEPFHCIRCAKPFGVRSTIERVVARLEGRHWMFSGDNASRLDLVRMCEDCRVEASVNEAFEPYRDTARPKPRTTDDYLREREAKAREAEMLERIEKGEA